jgi:hypothetical protein
MDVNRSGVDEYPRNNKFRNPRGREALRLDVVYEYRKLTGDKLFVPDL